MKDPAYKDTLYVDELVAPGHGQHHAGGHPGRHRRPRRRSPATRSPAPTRRPAPTSTPLEALGHLVRRGGPGCWRTRASRSSRRPGTNCSTRPRRSCERLAPVGGAELTDPTSPASPAGDATRCATRATGGCRASPGPSGLVIFGVTGDLSRKKLMPAVYDLANRGLLPPGFSLVGFARRDWEDEDFAQVVHDAVKEHARTPFREEVWQQLAEGMPVRARATSTTTTAFEQLQATIEELDKARGTGGNYAFYLSVPPKFFPKVVQQLKKHGLARARRRAPGGARSSRSRSATTWPAPRSSTRIVHDVFPPERGLPDRPLPGQGDRPEHPGAALRQHRCTSRSGTGPTSTTCRSRWPRTSASAAGPATTTASARPATSSRTTCCSCWR